MGRNNSADRYRELAQKWLDGTISSEEEREFADWYNSGQGEPVEISEYIASNEDVHRNRIYKQIISRINRTEKGREIRWFRPAVAATLLMFVLAGLSYRLFYTLPKDTIDAPKVGDVSPGGDKATLSLSDGTVLVLDDLKDGVIQEVGGLRISKVNGLLKYEALDGNGGGAPAYNTISTPRGGQFKVDLPDGSRVWLNSASELRYPLEFRKDLREVELLTGEAYFEVAKESGASGGGRKWPFRVHVDGRQDIEVLGTRFNVMAYPDEAEVKTALLEGSVRVEETKTKGKWDLKPGQQARLQSDGSVAVEQAGDIEETIAWVNGQISFKDADIHSIMRQVARWYDVEIVYEGQLPNRTFTGGISRKSNLSSLLKILELNDIHFELTDRTLTVSP